MPSLRLGLFDILSIACPLLFFLGAHGKLVLCRRMQSSSWHNGRSILLDDAHPGRISPHLATDHLFGRNHATRGSVPLAAHRIVTTRALCATHARVGLAAALGKGATAGGLAARLSAAWVTRSLSTTSCVRHGGLEVFDEGRLGLLSQRPLWLPSRSPPVATHVVRRLLERLSLRPTTESVRCLDGLGPSLRNGRRHHGSIFSVRADRSSRQLMLCRDKRLLLNVHRLQFYFAILNASFVVDWWPFIGSVALALLAYLSVRVDAARGVVFLVSSDRVCVPVAISVCQLASGPRR